MKLKSVLGVLVGLFLVIGICAEVVWADSLGKIVFGRGTDLWIMDDDGTNPKQLTNTSDKEYYAEFSPDGSKIAYINETTKQLFITNSDGSNQHAIYTSPYSIIHYAPTWSPDGSMIAFTQGPYNHYDIWTVNVDGSNPNNVTSDGTNNTTPAWSPDGSMIAFHKGVLNGPYDIYTINSDGSNVIRVTNDSMGYYGPVWSPDSDRFLFNRAGDLWVVNTDGTDQAQLTFFGDVNVFPDCSSSAPVPEPATMLLLGSGLVGLAGFRKKFKVRN